MTFSKAFLIEKQLFILIQNSVLFAPVVATVSNNPASGLVPNDNKNPNNELPMNLELERLILWCKWISSVINLKWCILCNRIYRQRMTHAFRVVYVCCGLFPTDFVHIPHGYFTGNHAMAQVPGTLKGIGK